MTGATLGKEMSCRRPGSVNPNNWSLTGDYCRWVGPGRRTGGVTSEIGRIEGRCAAAIGTAAAVPTPAVVSSPSPSFPLIEARPTPPESRLQSLCKYMAVSQTSIGLLGDPGGLAFFGSSPRPDGRLCSCVVSFPFHACFLRPGRPQGGFPALAWRNVIAKPASYGC